MDIKYYGKGDKLVKRELEVGLKWKDVKTSNKILNSIFQKLDDGDGVISKAELDALKAILKSKDSNKNNIADNKELMLIDEFYDLATARKDYDLTNNIYDDIRAKTRLGLPTTGKNIGKHIKEINKDNAHRILKVYNDKTNGKESLLSGIMSEYGLPINDRLKYCRHIVKQIAENFKDSGVYIDDILKDLDNELKYQKDKWTPADSKRLDAIVQKLLDRRIGRWHEKTDENSVPNGKIDKDFKQGATGDCWLIASIKAIASKPKGLKLLNDSINVDKKGNVTVTLKGVNKTYKFSKQEIEGAKEFSYGDLDVRALEMAMDRYFAQERGSSDTGRQIDLNGNNMHIAYYLLTGQGKYKSFFPEDSNGDRLLNPEHYEIKITDEHIENFNTQNHVVTVSSHLRNSKEINLGLKDGSTAKLIQNHAYSVLRSDKNFVYLVNPWDTSTEIPVPRDMFKRFFNNLEEFDLN